MKLAEFRKLDYEKLSKPQKIAIALFGLAILAGGIPYTYWTIRGWIDDWIGHGIILGDRIGMASVLVMQIDSFLAAGFIIGFFQNQGDVSRTIEKIARLKMTSEIAKPEAMRRLGSWVSKRGLSFFAGYRFFLVMSVLGLFVSSGLYSVRAVLFAARDDLVTSISLLAIGTILMIVFWGANIRMMESMSEQIGEHENLPIHEASA